MTECYECARLAELTAENSQLRVKVDELTADVSQAAEDTAERVTKTGENVTHDTREKLEADANGYVMSWWQSDWVDSFGHADSMKRDIMRLLDRQDAITANELTEQLESAHAKNRSLRAHIAKMQEGRHGWHVKYPELERKNAELKARVDELERENAKLSDDEFYLRCTLVDINGEVVG